MKNRGFFLMAMIGFCVLTALSVATSYADDRGSYPRAVDLRERSHEGGHNDPNCVVLVYLFENVGYQGKYRVLAADEANFYRIDFNDKASSIQVYGTFACRKNTTVEFFADANFTGGSIKTRTGQQIENLHDKSINFGDKISSMRIHR